MTDLHSPADLLGRFLRTHRARITLEQAGLPLRRGSRSGTLTQEDVARMTGYSVRTISALEQGTEHRPTPELLDAITAALRLGSDERHTLWYLAAGAPPPASTPAAVGSHIDPGLLRLLELLEPHPAYITDEVRDVLAVTEGAARWFGPEFTAGNLIGSNLTRWIFFYPHSRHVFPYWEAEPARSVLGSLRAQLTRMPGHRRLNAVVQELCSASPIARQIWEAQAQVSFQPPSYVTMRAPGHTDPGQPDDEHYHVTMTVAQVTPARPGDEHRLTAFMLPGDYADEHPSLAAQPCPACTRSATG